MGIASLVLGILAVLIGLFSAVSLGWLGAIMAIIGIILGALGKNDPAASGFAIAGVFLSILGLILCRWFYMVGIAGFGGLAPV